MALGPWGSREAGTPRAVQVKLIETLCTFARERGKIGARSVPYARERNRACLAARDCTVGTLYNVSLPFERAKAPAFASRRWSRPSPVYILPRHEKVMLSAPHRCMSDSPGPPLSRMRAASRRLTARLAAAFGCFSAAGGDAVPFAGTDLALANTIVMVLPCFLTEVAPASSASSTARRKSCHALPPPDRRRVDVATSPAGPLAACAAARAGGGNASASPISQYGVRL